MSKHALYPRHTAQRPTQSTAQSTSTAVQEYQKHVVTHESHVRLFTRFPRRILYLDGRKQSSRLLAKRSPFSLPQTECQLPRARRGLDGETRWTSQACAQGGSVELECMCGAASSRGKGPDGSLRHCHGAFRMRFPDAVMCELAPTSREHHSGHSCLNSDELAHIHRESGILPRSFAHSGAFLQRSLLVRRRVFRVVDKAAKSRTLPCRPVALPLADRLRFITLRRMQFHLSSCQFLSAQC